MQGFTRQFYSRPSAQSASTTAAERSGKVNVTGDGSTAHTKGAYAELIASLASKSYGLWVKVTNVGSSAAARNALLDIATGAASSETVIISNLNVSNASGVAGGTGQGTMGKVFYFPGLVIEAGTRLSARIQGSALNQPGTIEIFTEPSVIWDVQNSSYITYGADSSQSDGVPVSPSTFPIFGAWTEIGTTSRDHQVWTLGYDLQGSTTRNFSDFYFEVGVGPDSGSVVTMFTCMGNISSSEVSAGMVPSFMSYYVPSGSKLWCRAAQTNNNGGDLGICLYGN